MAKKRDIPETSKEAYNKLTVAQIDAHYAKIIAAFEVLETATADKIAEYIGMEHAQVNRRFNELRLKGIIHNTGFKLPTRRGRNAFVHTLSVKGTTVEAKPEKAMPGESVSDISKNITKIATETKARRQEYVQQSLIPYEFEPNVVPK